MGIHPTAIVDETASIHETAEIGPFCVVGPSVVVGARSVLHNNVVLESHVRMGEGNVVYPFAVIGGEPQDLKFEGEDSWVEIGNGNVIREYVTINRGTSHGGGKTIIGNGCLIMAYSHIAHDCIIGDEVIISNGGTLGGHIHIGRRAILSGLVAVHHFVTIGEFAFIGGFSKVITDVPPYMKSEGSPTRVRSVNTVGLQRAGFSPDRIEALKRAYKVIFFDNRGHAMKGVEELESRGEGITPEVQRLIEFLKRSYSGKKGRALETER